MQTLYQKQHVAFLTQHGKAAWVAPSLEPALGCRIVVTQGYDTDQLGTFSGEIAREQSQLATARTKAKIAMALTGARLGLGSEGAFTSDPFGGLIPWNVELLVWLDGVRGLEIVGMAQGPARSLQRDIDALPDLVKVAVEAGFPEHHLMLRPHTARGAPLVKGIHEWEALKQVFLDCQAASGHGLVSVENDLRAFCNPTRQAMIQRASMDLLKKLQSACPRCAMPGFAITSHQPGLRCRDCHQPTRLAREYIWHCAACHHRHCDPAHDHFADPARCDACNP